MKKTILITGSTDGIGLETAKSLLAQGHRVLLHGRDSAKLERVKQMLSAQADEEDIDAYLADLSRMSDVEMLAREVSARHERLDVLINNAGIYKSPTPVTADGMDIRFAVNTLAPILLTTRLMPLLGKFARVINLSSAAQAPVSAEALVGQVRLSDDLNAYAQSKLALTMWSRRMGLARGDTDPVFIALNPGSLLATKMVKEGFGMAGNDIHIGSDILVRAALSDEFEAASGEYFDNDVGRFAQPHGDALNAGKCERVVQAIERVLIDLERKPETVS